MSNKKSKRSGPGGDLKPTASVGPSKEASPAPAAPSSPPLETPQETIKPLFRRIDWYTFGLTTLITLIGYWWTLAPDLTLEDSGELAVASQYAGRTHPPGYPVWTLYTWFFTVFFPVSNIAYRVAFSSAVAAALSCGLVSLMVSRGSSMMIESIKDLKDLDKKWESALCMVSGFVAALLIGFNGFMWSQAVIVEVYTLSVLSLAAVLICLLRWIYAPSQRRYLYWAFFWFGISFNNHQSLLVTALGLEVAVLVAAPRLGRDLFFWNVVVWMGGLVAKELGIMSVLGTNIPGQVNPLFVIYNLIGLSSLGIYIFLAVKTRIKQEEFFRDLTMVGAVGYILALLGVVTNYVTYFVESSGTYFSQFKVIPFVFMNMVGLALIAGFVFFILKTVKMGREWLAALFCGSAWMAGAAFYIYMPLASMTNPPLNWGYPRHVQGFFHAFTRGQYERINPTTEVSRFIDQIFMYIGGALEEFNLVYLLIALVPFIYIRFMQKRERAWLIGLTAVYICLSGFLLILLNPAPDRQSRELNRVFFTASHVMIAMGTGYGLSLIGATLALHYERLRKIGLYSCLGATAIALFVASIVFGSGDFGLRTLLFDIEPSAYTVTRMVAALSVLLAAGGLAIFFIHRKQAPMMALIVLFALLPLRSIISHWSGNEQRGHLFGFWFGHDMFTPPFEDDSGQPIYQPMDKDTVLFGGTDPGRFNPTYMIFSESFIPPSKRRDPDFDRRDVYLITQNALADGTYLDYIRAHYNRSTQKDPYFFSELLRGSKEVELNLKTNFLARMMLPLDRFFTGLGDRIEMKRRVGPSWFKESDLTDAKALAARLKPGAQQDALSKYIFERLEEDTRELVEGAADEDDLQEALAEDLNRLMRNEYDRRQELEQDLADVGLWAPTREAFAKEMYDVLWERTQDKFTAEEKEKLEDSGNPVGLMALKIPRVEQPALQKQIRDARIARYREEQHQIYEMERFSHVKLSDRTIRFLKESPASHAIIRLNRILLEEAYPDWIAKSKGGLYPDLEIHTPTPAESQVAFQEYLADAQRRLEHDRRFPNEPKQIKPGEDVRIIENRVQVSGQVAVMAINGLLTKVIFDANPDHEFYVEESFPLDWMYPYLSPFGIIMKINRNPIPEITQEMVDKDHLFWSKYSDRLIGNWITYDTTVSNICDFVQRVHIRRDYSDYEGDRKFMRDTDGQKAFSKLRSSIGGIYNWRITNSRNGPEQQRMIKEAEFAFKQSYAYCPYSPEALFRFVQLLTTLGRIDEALLLATTSYQMDKNNVQIKGLILELKRLSQSRPSAAITTPPPAAPSSALQLAAENAQLEQLLSNNPANPAAVTRLVQNYQSLKETRKAVGVLENLINSTNADPSMLLYAAQKFNELAQIPKVELALKKLVLLVPDNPEAWYDLSGVQMVLNKPLEAMGSLEQALQNSANRRAADPAAANLYTNLQVDARFVSLHKLPEYQQLLEKFGTNP